MSIISKPINLSTEGNLLYEILREIDKLTAVYVANVGSGGIQSIVAGSNIGVDNTDPLNPIVSAVGGGFYAFENGLTEAAGTVKLGGTLTENTDLVLDPGLYFNLTNSNNVVFEITDDGVYLDGGAGNELNIGTNSYSFGVTTGIGAVERLSISSDGDISMPNTASFYLNGIQNSNNTINFTEVSADNAEINFNLATSGLTEQAYITLGLSDDNAEFEFTAGVSNGVTIYGKSDITVPTNTELRISSNYANFRGLEYGADYSADYTNRSLTDKEYVDTAVSDVRLKKNIQYIGSSLEQINRLRPATFEMIKNNEFKAGFIAQELNEVFPEMVITKDNGYLAIKKEQLVPYLVACVQELSREIEILKNK